ncbi:MAG: hypothetical protein JNK04_07235, partial [Myxococcales bacterium]|nr:hypothetical protein [Myxococcales bacterium]
SSIVAQEEKQAELDAAADQGASDMETEESSADAEMEAEKARTVEQAKNAEAQTSADQQSEMTAAQSFVAKKRGQWRDTQTEAVEKSQTDAKEEETEASEEIETERENADKEAAEKIETGEKDAKKEKADKEAEAAAKKAEAKKESSGFFGWLASKAKAAFDAIKSAVSAIMKGLRDAVKGIINAAKKLAVAAIEAARKVAVAAIRAAGDAIIAFGDVALAAFPEAREKFRGYINEKVADAEDAVNEFADDLKKSAEAFFDALGEFLDKAFQLLEKALLALIDVYAKAVDTIIKAAEAIAKAFGMFFMLIKDVASDPGGWISNLGAAVVDGIKNHLVTAMKDAISAWFKGKVEEVIGLPIDFMKALFSGGIDIGAIAKIAWSALKTAIPGILIQLLIEKLVAMVVPAAGAVMAIIEGLQAAWGTVSKILAAIDKFISFLKAVKGGGAGPQFAQAVAAGAVAVIDFVANWLLQRLMKPAKKVSGKLAAMAKKIMAKLKKGLKKIGKKIKKAVKKIKKAAKGLLKKKGRKKSKGGKKDKDKKKKDDKAEKEKKAEKKLKKARAAIERALKGGAPEPKARATVARIAAKNGAKVTFSGGKDSLKYTLQINPSLSDLLHKEDLEALRSALDKLNLSNKSAAAKIAAGIAQLRAAEGKAAGSRKDAGGKVLADAGGAEKFARDNAASLATRGKGPGGGHAHEKAMNAALAAKAKASDTLVHIPGVTGPGSDSVLIETAKGKEQTTNVEFKSDPVPAPLAPVKPGEDSNKTVPAGTDLKPQPGTEGSTKGQQHLGIGPGGESVNPKETAKRADSIVGGTPVVEPGGEGFLQNTLSAMTENLIPSLEGARDRLSESLQATRSAMSGKKGKALKKLKTVETKEAKALSMLNDIINGVGGKLRNLLALPEGSIKDTDASKRKMAEASALLAAGERKFKQACPDVEISSAIAEMTKDGNEVKS